MTTRLAGAVVALLAAMALVAGCGGDSSEAAAPQTVTVTTPAPAAESVDPATSEAVVDEPAAETPEDVSAADIDPADMEGVIDMYKQALGLSDTEARCVIDKAMKLGDLGGIDGATPDVGALMGSGFMSVFSDCNIDFTKLVERMSQSG